MLKELLNQERKIALRKMRMEFSMHLQDRFHVIMLRDPRSIGELSKAIGVSRDLLQNFISGGRRTSYKSLYKLEDWIGREEKRLGIII